MDMIGGKLVYSRAWHTGSSGEFYYLDDVKKGKHPKELCVGIDGSLVFLFGLELHAKAERKRKRIFRIWFSQISVF
jgi:hypothetical protein